MDTKATLLTLLASTSEPRWTISAIARASGVPWYAVRRYIKEPTAGLREEYQAQIDAFARLHSGDDKHSERTRR